MKKSIICLAETALLLPLFWPVPAQAATFTKAEVKRIHYLQNEYNNLNKQFPTRKIYSKKPHLTKKFKQGKVKDNYVQTQLDYLNFYRMLFNLPAVTMTKTDNNNAQKTAAIMASVHADPMLDQHGIKHNKRPGYISKNAWQLAKSTSSVSNLNFNYNQQAPGSVITDYITDQYNLTGSDTGHRAWVLSTRLSSTGFGTADSKSGCRYSVNKIANGDDIFRAASQPVVSYPASGVFPLELVNNKNIAWSLYLSDQKISGSPKISITDMDTGKIYQANDVHNYSKDGYGNFKTIITYYPGKTPLVAKHQYQVAIDRVYTYTFKLFNQTSKQQHFQQKSATSSPRIPKSVRAQIQQQSESLIKAQKLQATLNPARKMNNELFGRSYQDGKEIVNLGSKQWLGDFYRTNNPNFVVGQFTVPYYAIDLQVYSSPYIEKQQPTFLHLLPAHTYSYAQVIQIGNTNWFYLGPHQWVREPYGYDSWITKKASLK